MNNIDKIQAAVAEFGFAAKADGDRVVIVNKKGQTVAAGQDGQVTQAFSGLKNLCGSLVRNAIARAIQDAAL